MITAAVLCGGQGTRLRPVIGDSLPKCLAPVAGRPFLEYILKHLISQGVKKIVLCTGHGHDPIFDYIYYDGFADVEPSFPIITIREKEPLGTGGALRNALPWLDSDPILVVNGDTFCNFDLGKFLDDYDRTSKGWALTLYCGNSTCSSGVRLLSKHFLQSDLVSSCILQRMDDVFNNLGLVIGHNEWSFHDIGTPEGYAAAERYLRDQGVIP